MIFLLKLASHLLEKMLDYNNMERKDTRVKKNSWVISGKKVVSFIFWCLYFSHLVNNFWLCCQTPSIPEITNYRLSFSFCPIITCDFFIISRSWTVLYFSWAEYSLRENIQEPFWLLLGIFILCVLNCIWFRGINFLKTEYFLERILFKDGSLF